MAGIQDLNDASLQLIFAFASRRVVFEVEPGEHLAAFRNDSTLPCVCKRWDSVYRCSSLLWRRTAMECAVGSAWQQWLSRWLAGRAPSLQQLLLANCARLNGRLGSVLAALAPATTQLTSLTLHGLAGGDGAALHQLPALRALAHLGLHCDPPGHNAAPLFLSASALCSLSALTGLEALSLSVDILLGGLEEAAPALSRLTCLRLAARREAVVLSPATMASLSSLQRLQLINARLGQLTPAIAAAWAGLTHLLLQDVLAAKPRKMAGECLWKGLARLPSLQSLQLADVSGAPLPDAALACAGLRALSLSRCAADRWPGAAEMTVRPGCLPRLEALSLSFLRLEAPVQPLFWLSLRSLTSLEWEGIARGPAKPDPMEPVQEAMPVPEELRCLGALRALRLAFAALRDVPPCVLRLTRLTRLCLEGNRLEGLADGPYLDGLVELSLAGNALRALPPTLARCTALRRLNLAENRGFDLDLNPGSADVRLLSRLPLQSVALWPAAGPPDGQGAAQGGGEPGGVAAAP